MKSLLAGAALAVFLSSIGCMQPLRSGETRKITAWGFWAVVYGSPIGIGYWHSERGPDVESEQSAAPPMTLEQLQSALPLSVP